MLIAPFDITKLPHRMFGLLMEALLAGAVFLGVFGFLRWDLAEVAHQDRTLAEWEKVAVFVVAALASGVVVSVLSAWLFLLLGLVNK